jgi:hypothetical protein
VPDFLDEKRDEIDDRLAELRPLVEEYNRLQAASAALREVAGSSGARAVVSAPGPVLDADGAGVDVSSPDPGAVSEAVSVSSPAPVRRGPGRPRGSGNSGGGSRGSGGSSGNGIGNDSSGGGNRDGGGDIGVSSDGDAAAPAPVAAPAEAAPPSGTGPRRAGRPKGSGQRAAEALRVVREQPGVTIPELADRMGIKQNYLYRVLPELVQEGKVVKQGRGWHPRAA